MNHHWYVSSPHKVGAHGDEAPYGLRHARRPGKTLTECGENAINWPMFWDRPFIASGDFVCRACWNSLVHQETGMLPPQSADTPAPEATRTTST